MTDSAGITPAEPPGPVEIDTGDAAEAEVLAGLIDAFNILAGRVEELEQGDELSAKIGFDEWIPCMLGTYGLTHMFDGWEKSPAATRELQALHAWWCTVNKQDKSAKLGPGPTHWHEALERAKERIKAFIGQVRKASRL